MSVVIIIRDVWISHDCSDDKIMMIMRRRMVMVM